MRNIFLEKSYTKCGRETQILYVQTQIHIKFETHMKLFLVKFLSLGRILRFFLLLGEAFIF